MTPAGSCISVGDAVLHREQPDPPYYMHLPVCPAHSQPSLSAALPSHPAGVHPHVDIIDPMPFHHLHGRSVMLSLDRMVARRAPGEYCNGQVYFNMNTNVLGKKCVLFLKLIQYFL